MHALANPTRFLKLARPLTDIFGLGGIMLIAIGAYAGLFMVPADYLQGDSFRILYMHVPAAWLGMAGWSGIAVARGSGESECKIPNCLAMLSASFSEGNGGAKKSSPGRGGMPGIFSVIRKSMAVFCLRGSISRRITFSGE